MNEPIDPKFMTSEQKAAAIEKIKAKLPPGAWERIQANPSILEYELRIRQEKFPSKSFIPNIAQERALKWAEKRHPATGDFCKENHFLAGNGVGKTCSIPILLAGCCLGPEFVHPDYFAHYELFHHFKKIRSKRSLKIRLVCDGADMEQNGSLYQEISKWLPVAKMSDKSGGGGYYTMVTIPSPHPSFRQTCIDIKTFNQAITAHAGPSYDLIIFNEPPPEGVYSENASRIRTGGYVCGFLTPLTMAGYLMRILRDSRPGFISESNGSIWDNCKDIPGTRGVLTRQNIEDQIARWERLNPLEVPARRDGKFISLAGSIFQIFNKDVHVLPPPREIPNDWNIFFGCDHHPSKPACAGYLALDPIGNWYVIAEYPHEPWDQINGTSLTIRNFVTDFKVIEEGKDKRYPFMRGIKVKERFGDPNAFRAVQPHNRRSIKSEYDMLSGWDININVDNDIALRHNRMKELLHYDVKRAIDSVNVPHLFVYDCCPNTIEAFKNYGFKLKSGGEISLSETLDETWKDLIDWIGYVIVSVIGWTRESKSTYGITPMPVDEDTYSSEGTFFSVGYNGDRFI